MDYFEIVLQGYFNDNNREYLSQYFFREYKKAEKEYYEVNEFFDGCLKATEIFEKEINDRIFKLKKLRLLSEIREEDRTVNLFHLSNGRITKYIHLSEVEFIKRGFLTPLIKCNNRTNGP